MIVVLLCFYILASTPAQAQSGTISGQITDPQGSSVPGADLTLVDPSTRSTRATVSNEVGRYTFVNVAPGTYELTVAKPGLTSVKNSGINVQVGQALTLDFPMQLGSTSAVVEVTASAGAELQTLNSTVGMTIQNDSLNLLPNLGRDAASFTILQVGVGPRGDVAGANRDQSKFELDGGNNSDDLSGSDVGYNSNTAGGTPSGVVPTPIESVEEIKIATSGQTADFNSAAGSQIQMVTKRGTTQFHGTLYEFYFGSNVGAANTWSNNHTASKQLGLPYTPLPATHRNRFGGALGGPVGPRFWGGKTFFFANYEGMRFPSVGDYTRQVPTPLMRAGVITLPNSAGVQTAYNLNPSPVAVNGVTYAAAQCGSGPCDPRGLGLNPVVSQLWSQLPLPNDPNTGDGVNIQGYRTSLALPESSNFFVARIDHDFGDKWKFFSSYRYYSYRKLASVQTILSPDGQVQATATQPQKPSYMVAGLTTTITNHLTSDFRFSYLRNWWQWGNAGAQPQLPGLGGALEVAGEIGGNGSTYQLQPLNVNTVAIRQRYWDGQDKNVSESLSYLRGNHLFQFGGSYLRVFGDAARDDNGQGTDYFNKYQIATSSGIPNSAYPTPTGLASSQIGNWALYYSEVLGIVGQTIGAVTRTGANLQLNPPQTQLHGKSVQPDYNFYITDTWHLRPTLTISYGLSYGLNMPPTEVFGSNATVLVDPAGKPLYLADYFAQKQKAALAGQVYDPAIGFSLLKNAGRKYVTDPFYGGLGPRISVAWNPKFDSGVLGVLFGHSKGVIRGGYSRIVGRMNGVEQILTPLAGNGPFQGLSCYPTSQGACSAATAVTPATAFRIGADGLVAPLPAVSQTLTQPFFPGVNGVPNISDSNLIDPAYKPSTSDQVTFSVQRAFSESVMLEAGYIGRRIRDVNQQINIDAVPWMTTLNGQSFAQAFGAVFSQLCGLGSPTCANTPAAVTPQPFLEAALGGPGSAFCSKFSSCTAAVVSNYSASIRTTQVYSLWQSLSLANGWTLGRTLLSSPAIGGGNVGSQINSITIKNSLGYGNYNAAYLKFTTRNWRGLTATSNFTYGRSLGTQASDTLTVAETLVNPWDPHDSYGPQSFDIKAVYNLIMLYQPRFYRTQKGILGHILGGWSLAPLFTARSGSPLRVSTGTGSTVNVQAFGEAYGNGIQGRGENGVALKAYSDSSTLHSGVGGSNGVGTSGTTGLNIFADPAAVFAGFRPPVLGIDHQMGGAGPLRGFPTWNLDATASKEFRATERLSGTLLFMFTNVLNHFQPGDPNLNLNSPQTWGVINGQAGSPRSVEFGLRLKF